MLVPPLTRPLVSGAHTRRGVLARRFCRALASSIPAQALAHSNQNHIDHRGHRAQPTLSVDNMNQALREMQYAVRGQVPLVAAKMDKEIRAHRDAGTASPYPFDRILYCNIGNPQSVGQPPISFYRQVLALVDCPALLAPEKRPALRELFSDAEIARAEELVAALPGGSGAYSDSQGVEFIRRNVAQFIEARDGFPSDPSSLFLSNGASSAIQMLLTAILAHPSHAVLTPVPQYPIYSALITLLGGNAEGYYLDEARNWALHEEELERALSESLAQGHRPRAMVLINPGNPTGNTLAYEDVATVVRFCHKHGLVLLADEVYQENVYNARERPFVSAKRVMLETGLPIELASFHSTSKGFIGECGRRGGYMELCNFDEDVQAQIVKLASSGLCANLDGQVMVDLMVRPPASRETQDGADALAQFEVERDDILDSLREKARMVHRMLNAVPGVSCQPLEGAMYAFPRLELPERFVREARDAGKEPDAVYALSLLRHTGICTVPGSGFKQEPGTYHVRLTFLPTPTELEQAMHSFHDHHVRLTEEYSR